MNRGYLAAALSLVVSCTHVERTGGRICGASPSVATNLTANLALIGEPTGLGPDETYLFVFAPAFQGASTARITETQATFRGASLYGEVCGSAAVPVHVSSEEWNSLQNALSAGGFWAGEARKPPAEPGTLDGASWILSGVRNEKSRSITLWCDSLPMDARSDAELCRAMELMMRLAKAPLGWSHR